MNPPFDQATQDEVQLMVRAGGEPLVEAFYTDLEFGTGGLRGLMGPGTNRMNKYTVAQATQDWQIISSAQFQKEHRLP